MNNENQVLQCLIDSNDYISGEDLAKKLKVSRTAIWKLIKKLKDDGFEIISLKNKGYKIAGDMPINKSCIEKYLKRKDLEIIVKSVTSSTNDDCKAYINQDREVCVIAESQEKGRGRLNRSFYSPKNRGIYMSVLVKPNISINEGVKITTFVAVALSRVIEKLTELKVQIKWVNDLYINGKKVCGILTEAGCNFELKRLDYAICGIGINVYGKDFPKELQDIATSIEKESSLKINRNLLIANLLDEIKKIKEEVESGAFLEEYKERSLILNKEITVNTGNQSYKAIAKDITDTGALVVEKEGETIIVNSGDVSVRL